MKRQAVIASFLEFFKFISLNLEVNKMFSVVLQVNKIDIQEFRFLCMSLCIHSAKNLENCAAQISVLHIFFCDVSLLVVNESLIKESQSHHLKSFCSQKSVLKINVYSDFSLANLNK